MDNNEDDSLTAILILHLERSVLVFFLFYQLTDDIIIFLATKLNVHLVNRTKTKMSFNAIAFS